MGGKREQKCRNATDTAQKDCDSGEESIGKKEGKRKRPMGEHVIFRSWDRKSSSFVLVFH